MKEKNQPITDAKIVHSETDNTPSNNQPIMAFIAGLLVAVAGWYLYDLATTPATPSEGAPEVVATVDGEAVSSTRYTQSLEQSLAFATSQGVDVTDPAVRGDIEDQALESVINTRLLVTAAIDAGYAATEEAIDTQIANLTAQYGGEEAFTAEVEAAGLDTATLRTDIGEQIAVDEYLQGEVIVDSVEASEEEIVAFYDNLMAGGQELPPLDDIRAAIATQISQEREQGLVLAHIEMLRESADIEINI